MLKVQPTDNIGDIREIEYKDRWGNVCTNKYILGTGKNCKLKWIDYNLVSTRIY